MPRKFRVPNRKPTKLGIGGELACSLWFRLQPSHEEFRKMLNELYRALRYDRHMLCAYLGVSWRTLKNWIERGEPCSDAALRAVWLLHTLTLYPERIRSMFDIVTWGRYSMNRKSQKGRPKKPLSMLP
jgi:hypothetical protein